MKALAMLFLVGLFSTTTALAQTDVEVVEAAVLDFYARLNAGDATYASYWHPEATTYARGGGLLGVSRTESAARDSFDAGLEYRVTIASLDVKVFNANTALSTYYTGGLVRDPDGIGVREAHLGPL